MQRIACDKDWLFYENDEGNSFQFCHPKGSVVDLPHDFIIGKKRSEDAPGGASNGFFGNGEGVYRKNLQIPQEWKDKTVILDVDGAYMNMEVALNREVLSLHPNGYMPWQVDLTPALRFDGRKNELKIITQSRQPSTRWYSGGGLYRDVCLWVGGPVYIRPWDLFITTPEVKKKQAVISVCAKISGCKNTSNIIIGYEIQDFKGRTVTICYKRLKKILDEGEIVQEQFTIRNPKLWSTETPYLYKCKVILKQDESILDETTTNFGIRAIEVDSENGFRLNGEPMKLKGGCIHHDNGFLGACAYPKAEERKIKQLKELGYNAVRISHYPPSLEMLNICDREGMLLLDEAFDVWRLGKMPLDYHLYFEDWWERDIEAMVCRDRNHPCVITYSIGNEINESNGKNQGPEWSARLSEKIREFDNTRFILSAICGVQGEEEEYGIQEQDKEKESAHVSKADMEEVNAMGNIAANMQETNNTWHEVTAAYCEPLDIVGYNYLPDIYEEGHEKFPERVILGTETHSFQTYDYWKKVERLPYVIGDFIWTAVDYLGEAGIGKVYWEKEKGNLAELPGYPWRTAWDADVDLTGEQRPQSIYREILWGKTEKSGLFTTHPEHYGEEFQGRNWHWYDVNDCWCFENEWIGKPVKVDLYGAGDEAEFILNGESLGKRPIERLIATMDISYEPGVLTGIVYQEGKEISRCSLETPDDAAKIELIPEDVTFQADGKDLCYVRANIVDSSGRRLTWEDREISVKISNPGILLAVGSANPCTEDQITDPVCHLYRGTAILILKSKIAGDSEITVSADGVKDGVCMVHSV